MIALRLLGTARITRSNGSEHLSLLRRPKRFLLLAYLAISHPGRYHSRNLLLELFWPLQRSERRRAALRQALYVIREELGHEAVEPRGDESLRLAPGGFRCDVRDFESAVAGGRWREALEWWEGPLLPGFSLPGCPAFDDWLHEQRSRLERLASVAAFRLGQAEEAEGHEQEALDWLRRAQLLAPFDEEIVRSRIALLRRAGNRASAFRLYRSFSRRLRRELNVGLSEKTAALGRAMQEGHGATKEGRPP